MEKRHKSTNPVQRTVWHATGKDVLPKINAEGFNRSFAGGKHGMLVFLLKLWANILLCAESSNP